MLEAALHVETVALGPGELPSGEHVDRDADQSQRKHQLPLYLGRRQEPAGGLEADQASQDQESGAVGQRGEDLGPFEAVRQPSLRGPGSQPNRDQGQGDRGRIGQHVAGVRQEGQRVGEDADHDLGGHEAGDQGQR